MKSISLQVTYRMGRPSAAYIYLDRRPGIKSARTAELAADIVVDFASDDQPIGLEIVDPGRVTVQDILAVFDQLGLARPDDSELAPLEIWDTISDDPAAVPVRGQQLVEAHRRLAEHDADPSSAISWDQAETELRREP